MSTLITEAFGGTLANWLPSSPAHCSISGGALVFSADGCLVNTTSCGTGDKWFRFRLTANDANSLVVVAASGTGGCTSIRVTAYGVPYSLINEIEWTNYRTEGTDHSQSADEAGGTYNSATYVGLTLAKSTKVVRMWVGVTAAEPDSVTSWDSGAATAQQTLLSTLPGDYVGFGSWSSGGGASFDDFTAGDFSAGGGSTAKKFVTTQRRMRMG